MKQMLVDVTQLILGIVRATLDLVPDHAVPQSPSLLVGHGQRHPPRDPNEALVLIAVANVQPEGAGRLEDSLYLRHDRQELFEIHHVGILEPDASAGVRTLTPVRR